MKRHDIKLIARYVVLVYFMYLSYVLIQPSYILLMEQLKNTTVDEILYGAVFGIFGWIFKEHVGSKIHGEDDAND